MGRITELQKEVGTWSLNNFGEQDKTNAFLGIVEEVGELSHALLKNRQGIRGMNAQASKEAIGDALADIFIYMLDFCEKNGYNLEDLIEETWESVKKRNWRENNVNGKSK